MGMGPSGPSCLLDPPSRPPRSSLLLLLVCLLATVYSAVGECDTPGSCCELERCWNLYRMAEDQLAVRDDFHSRDHSLQHLTREEKVNKCITLRTLHKCIQNMTRRGANRGCLGDLSFHSAQKGVEKQLKQFNCSRDGVVFVPSDVNKQQGGNNQNSNNGICSYRGPAVYRHCGLFGDPHLRTFDDEFQTCKVQGAWPLIDNEYITVQVTNDKVGLWEGTATATSKLTVMIKQHRKCAAESFMTYQAQTDYLPGTFDDGSAAFGTDNSVQITEVEPGKHVEIVIRYISTTLIIRQIGRYFTFAVKMPEEVIKRSVAQDPDGLQLCAKGCPSSEMINYKQFLAQKKSRLKDLVQQNDWTIAMTRDIAEVKCRAANVVDFYFDSCVFDLMTTGDSNFTLAAYSALQDVLRLYPKAAKSHRNRTDFNDTDNGASSSVYLANGRERTVQFVFLLLVWTSLLTHCAAVR